MRSLIMNHTCVGVIAYIAPVLRLGLLRSLSKNKFVVSHSAVFICTVPKLSRCGGKLGYFSRRRCKFYSQQSRTCWKCGSAVDKYDLFCRGCDAVQKLDPSRNYFDLFGLEERYSVDLKIVQKTYRDLQRLLHPDLFNNKDEEEKKLSEEHSSLVNMAYTVLTHPLRRALYMLQLKGIDVEATRANLSQDFLMDIMERNEELDDLEDVDKIHQLSKMYNSVMVDLSKEVEKAFDEGDLEKAQDIVSRMKYFSNLETKVRDLRMKFGMVD